MDVPAAFTDSGSGAECAELYEDAGGEVGIAGRAAYFYFVGRSSDSKSNLLELAADRGRGPEHWRLLAGAGDLAVCGRFRGSVVRCDSGRDPSAEEGPNCAAGKICGYGGDGNDSVFNRGRFGGDGLYEPDGLLRSDAEGPDEGGRGITQHGIAGG